MQIGTGTITVACGATVLGIGMAMAAPGFGGGGMVAMPSPGDIGIGAGPYGSGFPSPFIPGSRPGQDDLSLAFRDRFLRASDNTNRLDFQTARQAYLVADRATSAAIDRSHRGYITLEDARRFVRDGDGRLERP